MRNILTRSLTLLKLAKVNIDESLLSSNLTSGDIYDLSIDELYYVGDTVCLSLGLKMLKFLGKGLHTAAYDVLYNGKRCVLKVTNKAVDFNKTKLINSYKDLVPEEYAKHFVTTYDASSLMINIYNNPIKIYYSLVEYLSPINYNTNVLNKINHLTFDDLIKSSFYKERLTQLKRTYKNLDCNKIVNWVEYCLDTSFDDYFEPGLMRKNKFVNDMYYSFVEQFDEWGGSDSELKMFLSAYYSSFLADYNRPTSYSETIEISKFAPKMGELYKMLDYLKKNFNIEFKDLHDYNIMQRSNGDLVLSDVGEFKL